MLETVDFSEEPLPKEEYKARRDALTERLVVLQQEARAAGVGLVVLFEGWNGAGKGSHRRRNERRGAGCHGAGLSSSVTRLPKRCSYRSIGGT